MCAGSSANVSIAASNFTSLRATTTVHHTCERSVLILRMQSQAGGQGGAVYGTSSAQIVIADSSFNACSAEVICLSEHAVTQSGVFSEATLFFVN